MNKNKEKVTFKSNAVTLVGNEIKVGETAPDFTVLGNALNPVKLSDYKGKTVILSVFPSLDTPVCATQNRTFNKEAAALSDNIVILGISVDLPFAQSRFCGAEGIDKVLTVSDYRDLDFSTKYGFLIEELRLLARGTVVIDKNGKVIYVEYVPEVTHEPNYSAALEAAKKSA
jgi:thiol peroxidase